MSKSIDARINTGYNGSNDGVTIFGKRIRINILKKGLMLIKFLIIQLLMFILLVVVVGYKYKENQG